MHNAIRTYCPLIHYVETIQKRCFWFHSFCYYVHLDPIFPFQTKDNQKWCRQRVDGLVTLSLSILFKFWAFAFTSAQKHQIGQNINAQFEGIVFLIFYFKSHSTLKRKNKPKFWVDIVNYLLVNSGYPT